VCKGNAVSSGIGVMLVSCKSAYIVIGCVLAAASMTWTALRSDLLILAFGFTGSAVVQWINDPHASAQCRTWLRLLRNLVRPRPASK
jgi:hypothetical protein